MIFFFIINKKSPISEKKKISVENIGVRQITDVRPTLSPG